ncbi:hypothetical protein C8R47DRAFT_1173490 [Mycena vitilis]|nr:hypothetical protein C8R47DRAFT_1173490 [Mycena vitilis]
MLSYKTVLLALLFSSSSLAMPIRREVPQEHSHQDILASVTATLAKNNPDGIVDPVFGLLGNAAAAAGLGKITDANCLQQATADQAFTNAKAAGDVAGQVSALIFRALERNSGSVGATTTPCTTITAVNPEIAAIQQHQDPASTGAAAVNKAIVLELAKQIAAVGGDPQDALKSGTFAPGTIGDPTAKGNSCDDANDAAGCINSQNLLVPDATADEITAAVGGAASGSAASSADASTAAASTAAAAATGAQQNFRNVEAVDDQGNAIAGSTGGSVSVAATGAAATGAVAASTAAAAASTTAAAAASTTAAAAATTAAASSSTAAASTSGNVQTFTDALGGQAAPPVTPGGKGFVVDGSEFINEAGALGRSCDVQHNLCANAANSGGAFSVGDCDTQNTACHAAITA